MTARFDLAQEVEQFVRRNLRVGTVRYVPIEQFEEPPRLRDRGFGSALDHHSIDIFFGDFLELWLPR